ncbi:CopG family ribbon-helix-helix protein [Pseudomonas oryziphila]|uniref:CopG family transcriptional regulator n=1 Tax=Pseudomonas entomophila TaxID=312306 RepID=A0A3Q8TZZ6_9PSED|nr:CopG family transcriptional regulator [Pseudomonas oryziphila]AZL67972.1 CopG family transcriptional regulator [Pseudomonas oryziphila]
MTRTTLNVPEDLFDALAELAKANGVNASCLAMRVLGDYIEQEKSLTAQIRHAVEETEEGGFATDEEVAALRARRWNWNAG